MQSVGMPGDYDLEHHGLLNLGTTYWNLTPAALVEQIILRREANLSITGSVVVITGKHTGRSPDDKFIVKNGAAIDQEIWWGKVNHPINGEKFEQIYQKICAYLQGKDVFIQDLAAAAHPKYRIKLRLITEKAWSALFAYDLFIRLADERIVHHWPEYTILHCPDFISDPSIDATRSGTVIALNFEKQLILIMGTSYAGEIKKSLFTVANFVFPRQGVLSMHCSANIGSQNDVALFFGLSGTGKTTLSSDPERRLIGDDEHGWSEEGVFNIEGGCYAKTIHLRPDQEPLIWSATRRFGAVLENVPIDPYTRELDFDDDHLTENTRGAYPIDYIPNHVPEGYAGHPRNIFFLTADAFGVIPPIARLSPDQAVYYFLSGYTSKLAGTETGLGSEPQATFSTCFGAPFLPLYPQKYADLLTKKIKAHKVRVWLVNTGWTGGPFGVGERMKLQFTRAIIRAALNGQFDDISFQEDTCFGLQIPEHCPGIPPQMLNPVSTWADASAYQRQADALIAQFEFNFKQFESNVTAQVLESGPRLAHKTIP